MSSLSLVLFIIIWCVSLNKQSEWFVCFLFRFFHLVSPLSLSRWADTFWAQTCANFLLLHSTFSFFSPLLLSLSILASIVWLMKCYSVCLPASVDSVRYVLLRKHQSNSLSSSLDEPSPLEIRICGQWWCDNNMLRAQTYWNRHCTVMVRAMATMDNTKWSYCIFVYYFDKSRTQLIRYYISSIVCYLVHPKCFEYTHICECVTCSE